MCPFRRARVPRGSFRRIEPDRQGAATPGDGPTFGGGFTPGNAVWIALVRAGSIIGNTFVFGGNCSTRMCAACAAAVTSAWFPMFVPTTDAPPAHCCTTLIN